MTRETSASKTSFGFASVLAIGLTLVVAAPANAASEDIEVPSDFVTALSDTRATGHYEVDGSGLRIWTEGTTSTDKVAEYVLTDTLLSDAGEPNLEYTAGTGGTPGFQLVVDFDGNGTADGILVGETVYGDDWWLNDAGAQFVKDAAPSHTGGSGSANHGTLRQWRSVFPDAVVTAFGFSLGSGVLGGGTIDAINFADTRFTFSSPIVLTGKEDCKKGGWATSTLPVLKNQGNCVSYFASAKR